MQDGRILHVSANNRLGKIQDINTYYGDVDNVLTINVTHVLKKLKIKSTMEIPKGTQLNMLNQRNICTAAHPQINYACMAQQIKTMLSIIHTKNTEYNIKYMTGMISYMEYAMYIGEFHKLPEFDIDDVEEDVFTLSLPRHRHRVIEDTLSEIDIEPSPLKSTPPRRDLIPRSIEDAEELPSTIKPLFKHRYHIIEDEDSDDFMFTLPIPRHRHRVIEDTLSEIDIEPSPLKSTPPRRDLIPRSTEDAKELPSPIKPVFKHRHHIIEDEDSDDFMNVSMISDVSDSQYLSEVTDISSFDDTASFVSSGNDYSPMNISKSIDSDTWDGCWDSEQWLKIYEQPDHSTVILDDVFNQSF